MAGFCGPTRLRREEYPQQQRFLPKPGDNPCPEFQRPEVERLLTDARIELDRCMTYGLAFFFLQRAARSAESVSAIGIARSSR